MQDAVENLPDRTVPNKRVPRCPKCKLNGIYDKIHDAYFCPEDDLWLESGCDNEDCEMCWTRPVRPGDL